jgi:hypothetical protein
VPVPGLDGDEADPLPELDGVDADPVEVEESVDELDEDGELGVGLMLPVLRSDVDGDADGVLVPRSLVLPDGLWLHPVARVATSATAKTPLSNFFMNTPPSKSHRVWRQQVKCR